jgi:hypothetical protein
MMHVLDAPPRRRTERTGPSLGPDGVKPLMADQDVAAERDEVATPSGREPGLTPPSGAESFPGPGAMALGHPIGNGDPSMNPSTTASGRAGRLRSEFAPRIAEIWARFRSTVEEMHRAAGAMQADGLPPGYPLVQSLGDCHREFLRLRLELTRRAEALGLEATSLNTSAGIGDLARRIDALAAGEPSATPVATAAVEVAPPAVDVSAAPDREASSTGPAAPADESPLVPPPAETPSALLIPTTEEVAPGPEEPPPAPLVAEALETWLSTATVEPGPTEPPPAPLVAEDPPPWLAPPPEVVAPEAAAPPAQPSFEPLPDAPLLPPAAEGTPAGEPDRIASEGPHVEAQTGTSEIPSEASTEPPVPEPEPPGEAVRLAALSVLDASLRLTPRDGGELTALQECQSRARALRDLVASSPASDLPPEAHELASREHPLCGLLTIAAGIESLGDAQWAALHAKVSEALGRQLAIAAARGRLVLGPEPIR